MEPVTDKARPASREPARRAPQYLPFSQRRSTKLSPAYGRFVGFMRILLPTIATALIVIVALWPQISDQQRRFAISPAKLTQEPARDLTMENTVFSGVDEHERPYSITAESARVVGENGSVLELTQPKADILLSDGSWVALTAQQGQYDREEKQLRLRGAVNLFHDAGYEFRSESATIDLLAGDARGTDPVQGQGPFGNIEAEGFIVRNRGADVEFTGSSKLILHPGQAGGK
jgi:lipopolysaccharide export system protein LptC